MTTKKNDQELHVVGKPVPRRDGLGHVKGTTVYYEDRQINDLLHLKMVRSPVPHGKLNGIDFSEAQKVRGFVTYLTHQDVPNNIYTILRLIGVGPDDEPVLAVDRLRWKGEAVAAIIAETEEAAQRAVSLVKLDYEELPPVLDVEEALKPGAPIIADTGVNYFIYENGMDHRQVRLGDVEKAFAEADYIIESRFQSRPIEHAPTETTGCIVVPEANGRYTVYTNTQALFFTLDNSGITLNLPFEKMHFVGGTVGGGFGGKVDVIVEPIAILAAMKTGRPVKFKYSRQEEMAISSPRGAWRFYYKDGVMKDGRIIARKVTTYADSGAYNRHTPYAVTKHAANAAGPYNIPNVSIDAYCVYTNKAPSSAMRGFAVTMSTWAIEQQMDKIAEVVGTDPWAIRFINAYKNGDIKPHRKVVEDATLIEVMQAAAEMAGVELPQEYKEMSSMEGRPPGPAEGGEVAKWQPGKVAERQSALGQGGIPNSEFRTPHSVRGTGISAVNYPTGMNLGGDPSQALIHATTTGNFVISLASTDLGQGLKTVIAQIAAETLGIPFENVMIDTADSDTGPHCMGTFASRATHRVGNAVIEAATEARKIMLDVAAEELEANPDDLETDGSALIKVKGQPDRAIHLIDLALAAHFKYARTISGRGMYMKPKSTVDPETGAMDPDSTEAHACVVADVEVDTETGEVDVLSLKCVYEIGRAVNPKLVEGQIVGGAFMGMAHALYETTDPYYPSVEHKPLNWSEYTLPGPFETPVIESKILEYPSSTGPYGVKGVGEMTANAPIPAIANAVKNAIGVRIYDLPITPERVLKALAEKAGS